MDPIRPITPLDRDVEPVWRVERTGRDAERRREQQEQQSQRREREAHEDPVEGPAVPPVDDDEPPHLIDVIA